MQFRFANDAAFPNLFFLQFELRLDQTNDGAVRLEHIKDRAQNQPQGYEREIHDDEVDRFAEILRIEVAQVDALPRYDPFVVSNFPGELIFPDIEGEHLFCTPLENAVGETSRRCPRIENDFAADIVGEFVEPLFNFQPAATDELRSIFHQDIHILRHLETGLKIPSMPVHENLTREDEALCHFPRVAKPSTVQGLIQSFFSHEISIKRNAFSEYRVFATIRKFDFLTAAPFSMKSKPARILIRLFLIGMIAVTGIVFLSLHFGKHDIEPIRPKVEVASLQKDLEVLDAALESEWKKQELVPTPAASPYTLIRRLSLALTGAPPSVEEIRRLEAMPEGTDVTQAWLDHLFADRRYANYIAERYARAFVGVGPGPFIVYRRRRLVNWLADQLESNRKYDALVRDLLASQGTWTTNPEANFITVAMVQGGEKEGLDEAKLAARTSRAFLGISLDCMQCHDDKFGDHWKQEDFHELAAFFAQSEISITGVREKHEKDYKTRLNGEKEEAVIEPIVPFAADLVEEGSNRRRQLANWITHENNRPFARAAVNRTWAFLFGRPLIDPVDDIPLDGPYPAGFEELTDAFIASDHDFQYLVRLIAASTAFQRDSYSGDPEVPVTEAQELAWAAFPVTPLRPEQVAGSIIQASSLQAIDSNAHIIKKLQRFGETNDFVKRYGDQGENEFQEEAGTIPQRLLLMNGKLVGERTGHNPIMNSSTRLADYAPTDESSIETAFLALLTRKPSKIEQAHFESRIESKKRQSRGRAMADVYWALINSTEFSWNR